VGIKKKDASKKKGVSSSHRESPEHAGCVPVWSLKRKEIEKGKNRGLRGTKNLIRNGRCIVATGDTTKFKKRKLVIHIRKSDKGSWDTAGTHQ